MKLFTGKGPTLQEATSKAVQAAQAEFGPDRIVRFELIELRGTGGGLTGKLEIEVELKAEAG